MDKPLSALKRPGFGGRHFTSSLNPEHVTVAANAKSPVSMNVNSPKNMKVENEVLQVVPNTSNINPLDSKLNMNKPQPTLNADTNCNIDQIEGQEVKTLSQAYGKHRVSPVTSQSEPGHLHADPSISRSTTLFVTELKNPEAFENSIKLESNKSKFPVDSSVPSKIISNITFNSYVTLSDLVPFSCRDAVKAINDVQDPLLRAVAMGSDIDVDMVSNYLYLFNNRNETSVILLLDQTLDCLRSLMIFSRNIVSILYMIFKNCLCLYFKVSRRARRWRPVCHIS